MSNPEYLINKLGLIKHSEGGWYKENYRSSEFVLAENLPERFNTRHCFSTAIYFLLTSADFSAFHRIKQDEIWHFYDGSSLTIHVIDQKGKYLELTLGKEIHNNENLQVVVQAGWLFAASVQIKDSFTLTGCTVAPGFEFADFEMPSRNLLLKQYPQHKDIIKRFSANNTKFS